MLWSLFPHCQWSKCTWCLGVFGVSLNLWSWSIPRGTSWTMPPVLEGQRAVSCQCDTKQSKQVFHWDQVCRRCRHLLYSWSSSSRGSSSLQRSCRKKEPNLCFCIMLLCTWCTLSWLLWFKQNPRWLNLVAIWGMWRHLLFFQEKQPWCPQFCRPICLLCARVW